MDDKLSIQELNELYSALQPMFHSVLYQSSVVIGIVEVATNPERAIAQEKRDRQDEENKIKIRSSLW